MGFLYKFKSCISALYAVHSFDGIEIIGCVEYHGGLYIAKVRINSKKIILEYDSLIILCIIE